MKCSNRRGPRINSLRGGVKRCVDSVTQKDNPRRQFILARACKERRNVIDSVAERGRDDDVPVPTVYHGIPVQRCWAHKIRNVLDKVRKADREAVKADLHAVMNADNLRQARAAARRFAANWAGV